MSESAQIPSVALNTKVDITKILELQKSLVKGMEKAQNSSTISRFGHCCGSEIIK